MRVRCSGWRTRRGIKELPLLFGKGAPARAEEVLQLVAAEPDLATHVTGARLVGERRWDIYLDGRIEVRLPGQAARGRLARLAAEQRATAVIARAVTVDRPAQSRTG